MVKVGSGYSVPRNLGLEVGKQLNRSEFHIQVDRNSHFSLLLAFTTCLQKNRICQGSSVVFVLLLGIFGLVSFFAGKTSPETDWREALRDRSRTLGYIWYVSFTFFRSWKLRMFGFDEFPRCHKSGVISQGPVFWNLKLNSVHNAFRMNFSCELNLNQKTLGIFHVSSDPKFLAFWCI